MRTRRTGQVEAPGKIGVRACFALRTSSVIFSRVLLLSEVCNRVQQLTISISSFCFLHLTALIPSLLFARAGNGLPSVRGSVSEAAPSSTKSWQHVWVDCGAERLWAATPKRCSSGQDDARQTPRRRQSWMLGATPKACRRGEVNGAKARTATPQSLDGGDAADADTITSARTLPP
ncbi:hypothetical protein IWX90DRAFT_261450 [Phyllosticta citrichinensis]|uniref:Uncharacterized protein n=1 Tax=Phyllosticta citrichinensis TaxID=1130410 RepID=A0ABR1XS37_9PEZI